MEKEYEVHLCLHCGLFHSDEIECPRCGARVSHYGEIFLNGLKEQEEMGK